jgi:Protein of unknown function (DUF3048) N-terminal domain/Protein of unknown function (DUF3048) C-terminal domain
VRKSLILAALVIAVGAFAVIYPRLHKGSGPSAPGATTSTTAPSYPIAPLTGLPDPGGSALARPALTVKVENTPDALPQYGIDQADVVYEEIVNGGITRLAAVFNSHAPAKIGPVRSVRPTDASVVWPLGGIFAYSGGAPYAVTAIGQVPHLKLIDESSAGLAMFRDPSRYAPHNLYAIAGRLFAFKGTPTPPPALFTYRAGSAKAVGPAVRSVVVPFPSIYAVTWTWNTTTASWDRTLFGKPIITGTNVRVSPKNVVVMWVNYVNGVGTFTSYADLTGSGNVAVFSGGKQQRGTWSRGSSKSDVITYTTAAGKPIALTPGQTWVELLNTGAAVHVTP